MKSSSRQNKKARFRFYAELNDFLPQEKRGKGFDFSFKGKPAVKDTIECLGVPHTEVDLILVNGKSAAFSYNLQDGDQISVYPVFESMDIASLIRVRPAPLRQIRFVLDVNLGRLAKYLRLLGFDTLWSNSFKDKELTNISKKEHRVLLTRDRDLLKRGNVSHGYFIRKTDPKEQTGEVVRRFDLSGSFTPFQRCMECNQLLEVVEKKSIQERLEPKTEKYFEKFFSCPGCNRIYWEGSHFEKMKEFVQELILQETKKRPKNSDKE